MIWDLLLAALLIFLLRIADVSLGTLRITMLVRGQRGLAGLLGFFESLIWLLAAARYLGDLDGSIVKSLGYAGGYAVGTMLGTTIERWIAIGNILVRVIERTDGPSSVETLRAAGFYATVLNATGRDGGVQIIFTVIPRRRQNAIINLLQKTNPAAYVTFEDTTTVRAAALSPASVRK
jgi:uncharacterized protein YebE (UPF0316 family)